jgi:hypothetical protein
MLLLILLGCISKTVYNNPDTYLTSVSAGGGSGEFYISSNIMCGKQFVTSRITLCKYNDKLHETLCVNVAETDVIGIKVANNGTAKFQVSATDIKCKRKIFKLDLGESGWAPTNSNEETFID